MSRARLTPRRSPAQLTTFVGRGGEIATIRELLNTTRLLTLTGAGGSGKTRLALEVAALVTGEFVEGVAWVDLAALAEPDTVAHEVAVALGLRARPGGSPVQAMLALLPGRSLLLILDNCEHVLEASAELATTLLAAAPELRILATSRAALGIGGETAWLVPPMSLPDLGSRYTAEKAIQFEAVQLFAERARAVVPALRVTDANAAAIVQICVRLDGIPLALELAAARMRALTPGQVAKRLDDRFRLLTTGHRTAPRRHQTLHAAIDWSYALLSDSEQLLLERLSVLAGRFSLEAAESICGADGLARDDVLDLLAALVDKSLVVAEEQRDEIRYRLLDSIRDYALQKLSARADPGLRRRHAEFFADLVEQAEPHLLGPRRGEWGRRLLAEQDNLRAALAYTTTDLDRIDTALRLAGGLWWFWHYAGAFDEAVRSLEQVLRLSEARGAKRGRALTLYGLAAAAWMSGDAARGSSLAHEAAEMFAELGDHDGLVRAMTVEAFALRDRGSNEEGLRVAAECVQVARRPEIDPTDRAFALLCLAGLNLTAGMVQAAHDFNLEAQEQFRSVGSHWGLSQTLHSGAVIALHRDRPADALRACRDALLVLRREDDVLFTCRVLEITATTLSSVGNSLEAARLLGAAEGLREPAGAPVLPFERARYDTTVARVRTAMDEETFEREWAAGKQFVLGRAVEFAIGALDRRSRDSDGSVAHTSDGVAGDHYGAQPATTAQAFNAGVQDPRARAALPLHAGQQRSGRAGDSLHVRALGPLRIDLDGRSLPPEAWSYTRPRELLLYLLCHSKGRTREQIGHAFWPEASAAQMKNSFHVTLHHLRKTLGRPDWIVIEGDRYTVTPDLEVSFDGNEFERAMRAALQAVDASGPTTALRTILSSYQGDFLQDEVVGDWHLTYRDRWRLLFIDGLAALGEQLVRAESWAEAAESWARIIRLDDLREDAYRRLMVCLSRLGDRTRALRHYDRLVTLLRDELDADPEPATMELAERLRRAKPV